MEPSGTGTVSFSRTVAGETRPPFRDTATRTSARANGSTITESLATGITTFAGDRASRAFGTGFGTSGSESAEPTDRTRSAAR